ncbi:MAG: hypothetical protein ACI8T1_002929 [Verrucomicrobiales bacterium]
MGGDGVPNAAFFREVADDNCLIVDRPEAPVILVATLSEAVPTVGTRVSYQFSTKRTGGHPKDYHVVGIDADGNESFHIVASASNTMEVETLRLGYETEDGPIWDFETTEGEDSDGDFSFNNSKGNINNVGTAVLSLVEDGYVLKVSKGLDDELYITAVIQYSSANAASIAIIEIRINGGATGFSTSVWLDDLTGAPL